MKVIEVSMSAHEAILEHFFGRLTIAHNAESGAKDGLFIFVVQDLKRFQLTLLSLFQEFLIA